MQLDDAGPRPVKRVGQGCNPLLLPADHAGRRIPPALSDLGLDAAVRARHIAWDIGIHPVTERLTQSLSAAAIAQTCSCLVIDCNRRPSLASSIPEISETTAIPGNQNVSPIERTPHLLAIFEPYHAAIAAETAARQSRSQPTLHIAMRSFTLVFKSMSRQMHAAVLYNYSPRLSRALATLMRAETEITITENDRYSLSDETELGVHFHFKWNGLDYIEIEIRQDLITDHQGLAGLADRLAHLLPRAASSVETP